MLLRYLAHQHGPAAVACVFVCYKYVKFRLVCWRKDCVNEQVCGLVQGKLVEEDDVASGQSTPETGGLRQPAGLEDATFDAEVVPVHSVGAMDICSDAECGCGGACRCACRREFIEPQQRHLPQQEQLQQQLQQQLQHQHKEGACASCGVPLWLRRDGTEFGVRLASCGCFLHYGCLLEVATLQHGMTLPSILDPFHFLTMLRRLFGVDAVAVDTLECPGCNSTNQAWARVRDSGTVVSGTGTAATSSALHQGAAICLSSLRTALLELAANIPLTVRETLHQWPIAAARSDAALRELLQQAGSGALPELKELLPDPAARPEAKESAEALDGEVHLASSHDSTYDVGTAALPAAAAKVYGACRNRRRIVPAKEHCSRPRASKVYSEFLWLVD